MYLVLWLLNKKKQELSLVFKIIYKFAEINTSLNLNLFGFLLFFLLTLT